MKKRERITSSPALTAATARGVDSNDQKIPFNCRKCPIFSFFVRR